VTLHSCYDYPTSQGCRVWSATDNAGVYSAGPFLYRDMNWITRTYDIKAGDTGQVYYTNPDFNSIFINYAATGVATTIAGGGVRAGATAVMGTAVPGVTVEIWDVTENALIGTGVAGADARFAINVSPPLIYGHTIVAIANGLPSIGHIVQRAVTINGPTTSVTNTIGLYGIAPANATVVIYLQESIALPIKTVQAGPNGYWNTTVSLPTGASSLYALVQGTGQESDVITIIVDPTAVAIGESTGSTPGDTYQSDPSGQNHFPVFGGVQPLTITVEILNNPCTVTLSFMGETITATAGTTPDPRTYYTVVFTDYTWEWGTHEVNVNAISCGGTAVSQKVAEVTLIDPSGYVYDALTGEKVQGATATCYYSNTIAGEWVVWEAALYNNQINPQLTDATGWYGFMVPEGYYYVAASAPGYEDNQTIVYYIPPEVTDAHIPLTPIAGYPATVTLTVVPTTIPVGGADSLLTAVIVDRYGNPVDDGTVVTFTSTLGSVDGSTSASRTTVGGIATATLTSSAASGVATVTAETEGGSDTATVTFAPGASFTVTLTAHPTMLPINGATAWLTATVTDEFSNPVADGTIITFTADLGTLNPGNTTSLPIPTVSGIALATFATEAVTGTATITATAGTRWDIAEIIIYAPVSANFTANPTEGVGPLAVTFTNQSTGDYTAQTWNFGDGGTSVAQHPVYTYTTAGVFTVTLAVSGPGGSDTFTRTSYIAVTEPSIPAPEVDFVGAPRSGDAPLAVQFTSTVTNAVTSYAWTFGDGGIATTANPTYTYQNAGSYGVSLVVTGPGGTAQAVKSGYITVNPPSSVPTATFSADVVSGTAPLNVTFTAVTSGTVEGWLWDFGDGGMSTTGPVVQYTYTTPGSFDVRLTVSNTNGSYIFSAPRYITVTAPPSEYHYIYLPLVVRAH